ncbi:hypothetical protein AB0M46_27515 [Dactylosporangium sp. NPDC051485]|uniref:hypothetical protein n=1 Tax=Dactylosporangium sp. NPDC051485 TaxID=3154846 RepID=UPI00342877BD
MAQTIYAVLTEPDEAGERDIEIRYTDSFLRVRAEEAPARPRERNHQRVAHEG